MAAVVDRFASRDKLVLAVAPEGARKPGAGWKTGFWHIAHGAGVPIVPVAFDWEHRIVRVMPLVEPRDIERDMQDIQARYSTIRGHHS